jgi:hypothetical protein
MGDGREGGGRPLSFGGVPLGGVASSRPGAVVAGEALVEGIAPGGGPGAEIEGGGRIEGEELALGWSPCRREGRRVLGKATTTEEHL